MQISYNKNKLHLSEIIYNNLCSIESIIDTTTDSCLKRELLQDYYGTTTKRQRLISQERNNYINMLNLAKSKITEAIELHQNFEETYLH